MKACQMRLNIMLAPYFSAKQLWVEGTAIVGKASDGTIVQIGQLGEWASIESYLTANPKPEQW